MSNNDKKYEEFSRSQLEAEGEAIKKEVESDHSLDNIEVSPEQDERMMNLINMYDRNQEKREQILREKFERSEETGRMSTNTGGNAAGTKEESAAAAGKVVRFRKKRRLKRIALVAAVMIMLLGVGMSSTGNRNLWKQLRNQMNGERDMIQIDTDEEEKLIVGRDDEEEAYSEIIQTLGVEVVRPEFMPEGTVFTDFEVEQEIQMATVLYSYKDVVISYQIIIYYNESSIAHSAEEGKIDTYCLEVKGTEITVNEYERSNTKQTKREAVFEYKNAYYILCGVADKAEFDEILKNLHFF